MKTSYCRAGRTPAIVQVTDLRRDER